MLSRCNVFFAGIACVLAVGSPGYAGPAAFDLQGPTLETEVTRAGTTLPAARVPSLAAGDKVWMKADLPADQSAHYILVAAFLMGATNPPSKDWFVRCDTWSGKCASQGMTLTVPKEAQQLLVFLAPETGGDYKTLVDAVRGRPGAFVRTSQDLHQATLDRSRLDAYLAAVRHLGDVEPGRLREAAPLLARSLAIKVDEKCLEKIPELQAPCLTQGGESLILDDGHSASIAQELTTGPAGDLAFAASSTPQLKSGYYGPFIGTIFDIARILDEFHTAQYQYIPALASANGRQLQLTLNSPPSFHDPKSVLVVALPAVEAPRYPALHEVEPREVHCEKKDPLVLPVEGAPLIFATAYAHDMYLRVPTKDGGSVELPAHADATRGGFTVDTGPLAAANVSDNMSATLHGSWGFDKFDGPSYQLVTPRAESWRLAAGDAAALIVGRQDIVRLQAGNVSCLSQVTLSDAAGKELKVEWKALKADEAEVHLPLQDLPPGDLTLLIRQYGQAEPQKLALHAYAEAGHLVSFSMHAGDGDGVLRGNRLDEVQSLVVRGVEFVPDTLSSSEGRDELSMLVRKGRDADAFKEGDSDKAKVVLKDGRTLEVQSSVDAPRPSAILIDKNAQLSAAAQNGRIVLASHDELPQDARLTFSLRAKSPAAFARDEKIEIATLDGSSSATLVVGSGEMMLQSSKVAVATLDPAKAFGTSAFGPLQFRRVSNGVPGSWRRLTTLVRLPVLKGVECPPAAAAPALGCQLTGANLFLLDAVSGDRAFTQATQVPDGFTGQTLPVQRPTDGHLYVKLRDDPSVINMVAFDMPPPPAPEDTHPGAAPQSNSPAPPPQAAAPASPPPPASKAADGAGAQVPAQTPAAH
jgi:hypothetical protein